MSPTTPGGWPYVTGTDEPRDYPAVSLDLATKLEAHGPHGGGGVTDHGALTGLTDADHPITAVIGLQTALDGKAPLSHSHAVGDLPSTLATDAEVTAAISTHAATPGHELLATTTPADLGVAAVGTGTTTARSNHVHKMPSAADVGAAATAHTHTQAQSHNSPDTDAAPGSLHHTLGTGANQSAAGNHTHAGVYDPAGTAAAGDAAHAAAADPHTVYLKPTEVLAGTNITVDTTTTPGAVIINGGAGGGPAGPPVTTGGTVIPLVGAVAHRFTTSGTFTTDQDLTVDVLTVAGGGGGGYFYGGGGGAGGVQQGTGLAVAAGTYTITVGAGGAGVGTDTVKGGNGGNSSAFGLVATGGGGGGSNGTRPGANGGSGGGGCLYGSGAGGSATSGQGFAGAAGNNDNRAGGGGGAGGAGNTSIGGAGISNSITGVAVTYAAGGGGAYSAGGGPGTGGSGGVGGNGATGDGVGGTNATANTGSGGGGAVTSPGVGGSGSAGVVVIRYAVPLTDAVPAGGTTGQVLAKTSAVDYATAWATPTPPTPIKASSVYTTGPGTTILPVTFPVGRFSVPPMVLATVSTGGNVAVGVNVHTITTTGCSFYLYPMGANPWTSGGVSVFYLAIAEML